MQTAVRTHVGVTCYGVSCHFRQTIRHSGLVHLRSAPVVDSDQHVEFIDFCMKISILQVPLFWTAFMLGKPWINVHCCLKTLKERTTEVVCFLLPRATLLSCLEIPFELLDFSLALGRVAATHPSAKPLCIRFSQACLPLVLRHFLITSHPIQKFSAT